MNVGPGRKRLDSRKVLCGILFVLYTGIRWEFLPQELGFGSGMTCWRRLRDWNEAGVWRYDMPVTLTVVRITRVLGQTLGGASEDRCLRLAHTG
jgi:transposase